MSAARREAHGHAVYGPDGMRRRATQRNRATRIRVTCSITRSPILIKQGRARGAASRSTRSFYFACRLILRHPNDSNGSHQVVWMVVRIRAKMAQRKKLAWPLRSSQLLLAVERLVANDGWVTSRVKAVSRRRRGPQARLYRACHPAILDHRGRRLTPATLLPPPSMRGFTPPVTSGPPAPFPAYRARECGSSQHV